MFSMQQWYLILHQNKSLSNSVTFFIYPLRYLFPSSCWTLHLPLSVSIQCWIFTFNVMNFLFSIDKILNKTKSTLFHSLIFCFFRMTDFCCWRFESSILSSPNFRDYLTNTTVSTLLGWHVFEILWINNLSWTVKLQ